MRNLHDAVDLGGFAMGPANARSVDENVNGVADERITRFSGDLI